MCKISWLPTLLPSNNVNGSPSCVTHNLENSSANITQSTPLDEELIIQTKKSSLADGQILYNNILSIIILTLREAIH